MEMVGAVTARGFVWLAACVVAPGPVRRTGPTINAAPGAMAPTHMARIHVALARSRAAHGTYD
jgi:hypothetical protein